MKSLLYLPLLLQLLFYLHAVRAGPIVISNGDDVIDDVEVDDEFTTQTVERLSSAATCLVASIEYTHGQQIYRADPCEFCLCLDGEMFCWWQDCPPALEGPCKDKRPFTSCQALENENAIESAPHLPPAPLSRRETSITTTSATNSTAPATSSPSQYAQDTPTNLTSGNAETLASDSNNVSSISSGPVSASASASAASVDVTTVAPKRCSIMGRLYNIGDRLPHTTGNCVECICGAGAQILCSPHQCGPSVDDINEYRPEGLRSGQPDVF